MTKEQSLNDASTLTPQELTALERQSANRLDLGAQRWALLALVVVYVLALFLPFAGDANGWQIVSFGEPEHIQTAVTERAFALLSFITLPILTTATVASQRTVFAMLAWMTGSVTLVAALLGLWLRQTGSAADAGVTTGGGMYLAIFCVLAAVPFLAAAWLRRDPEQQRLEALRRENTEFNPVAEVQTDAAQQAVRRTDGAEGIVDDRRQRAAERHRRSKDL